MLTQPQQASTAEPELGTVQPQLVSTIVIINNHGKCDLNNTYIQQQKSGDTWIEREKSNINICFVLNWKLWKGMILREKSSKGVNSKFPIMLYKNNNNLNQQINH